MSDQNQPATCGVCAAPSGDHAYLCRTHSDALGQALAGVPALVLDLEVTVTRQDRIAAEHTAGRSATTPLPWNDHASQRAFELNATLNAWALDVSRIDQDERDRLAAHHHSDTAAVARWLRRNLSTLRQHPEAGSAYAEVTNSIQEARRAVDRPPVQEVYGQCYAELEDGSLCAEYLYAPPARDVVTCRACRFPHDAPKRRAWMFLYVRDRIGTVREVVACLTLGGIKTTEDKVRLMASRDRFYPAGHDAAGKPLYRVSEVLAAIEDRYKHRKPKAAA